ncbi:unnamed protein product [Sphagnum jensenii]|uniref:Hpc2-related domain-containing protein n=1 Tax=Sphagnum jensenii TaxID=128206 RepID=A0ABP0X6A8_9BRYO
MPARQRFFVDLKDGETTVVSWKKLTNDAEKNMSAGVPSDAPAGANPALEARIAPETVTSAAVVDPDTLPPPPNRFSSVIERIERLYKGGDSDEENVEESPDEDQYDTDDPFIDDEELNEYFMVEKAKTKHTGFFINRGALEKISVAPPDPAVIPKKRKRRDVKKVAGEKIVEDSAKRRMKVKSRMKVSTQQLQDSGTHDGVGAGTGSEQALTRIYSSEPEDFSNEDSRKQPKFDLAMSHTQGKVREFKQVASKPESSKKAGVLVTSRLEVWKDGKSKARDVTASKIVKTDGGNVLQSSPGLVKYLANGQKLDQRFSSHPEEKKWKEVTKDSKLSIPVSGNLMKLKMLQHSTKEEGVRDYEGAAGRSTGSGKSSSPGPKESSPSRRSGWPKGTMMERAIQDLEKGVAEYCPPRADGEEPEQPPQSGGKAKRLPREVKQKLAKVARLAQAREGKVPDELVDRLMGILGHVMRLTTLKRNLKEMVELGLSAKQEKEGRILDIKREVTEMVKSRVLSLQAQDADLQEGSLDDFQAAPGSAEKGGSNSAKYKWDHATEDRLCDLYEQYLEGMDEHKGPQTRKLYIELAEIWPEGWMDNVGIKAAVSRAKERKKRLTKLGKETKRKPKILGPIGEKQKASEDRSAEILSILNKAGQRLGPLVTKPKPAVGNPEDHSGFSVPNGPRPWATGDAATTKTKALGESHPIKILKKSSKHELKDKVREGMEQGFRVGSSSFGRVAENALLKKIRRKKLKTDLEHDLSLPPALMMSKTDDVAAKDISHTNVPQISKRKLSVAGEIPGKEMRREKVTGGSISHSAAQHWNPNYTAFL